jgi:hypothetical protein
VKDAPGGGMSGVKGCFGEIRVAIFDMPVQHGFPELKKNQLMLINTGIQGMKIAEEFYLLDLNENTIRIAGAPPPYLVLENFCL